MRTCTLVEVMVVVVVRGVGQAEWGRQLIRKHPQMDKRLMDNKGYPGNCLLLAGDPSTVPVRGGGLLFVQGEIVRDACWNGCLLAVGMVYQLTASYFRQRAYAAVGKTKRVWGGRLRACGYWS